MNQERKDFLENYIREEFDRIYNGDFPGGLGLTEESFSWESFWKFGYSYRYMLETQKELSNLLEISDNSQRCLVKFIYEPLKDEDQKFLISFKDELMSKYSVRTVTLSDLMPSIEEYFTGKGVDFKSQDKEEQYKLLSNEFITLNEVAIHKHLNITRIQFGRLYQEGSVFIN